MEQNLLETLPPRVQFPKIGRGLPERYQGAGFKGCSSQVGRGYPKRVQV